MPIFSHAKQSEMLPVKAGAKIQQIQEMRHLRKTQPTPTKSIDRFVAGHQSQSIKRHGKILGSHLSALARKMKGKK